MRGTVEVGKGERWRLQGVERLTSLLGRQRDRDETGAGIHCREAAEGARDGGDVEAAVDDQRTRVADRDADVVAAEPFGLELPPEGVRKALQVDQDAIALGNSVHGAGFVGNDRDRRHGRSVGP